MAARRPRTVGRLISKSHLGLADRDDDADDRGGRGGGKLRKRKLSDMLGPPWSKEDLEQFYQAYRKYGKDWVKVAGAVSKRTVEMVEALYGMNKAYLSLPEATTSPEVLIAMMTDHYNILDERRSEDDEETSSEDIATSDRSHHTNSRLRTRIASNSNSGTLNYGGPSPAKKPRSAAASRPRIVGKRTPRYPSAGVVEPKAKAKVLASRLSLDATSDEDNDFSKAAHALVSASQRAASPLVPGNTPERRKGRAIQQNGHPRESVLRAESGGSGPKHTASTSGEFGNEVSRDTNEKRGKGTSSATAEDPEVRDGVKGRFSEVKYKWKKTTPKRLKLHNVENYDDVREECSQSGTHDADLREEDEERSMSAQRKKRDLPERTKKRSRQLFSGEGQNTALDTLATLADLSLAGLLPSPTGDSDPGPNIFKLEEKLPRRKGFSPPKSTTSVFPTDNLEKKENKKDRKESEEERNGESDKEEAPVASASGQQSTSPPDSRKRKRIVVLDKNEAQGKGVTEEESQRKPDLQVPSGKMDIPTATLKQRSKPKRGPIMLKGPVKQGSKSSKIGEREAGGVDQDVPVQGHGQAVTTDEGGLPLKLRSKKKGLAEKAPVHRLKEIAAGGSNGLIEKEPAHCPHAPELGVLSTKARLIHCLSSKVRRWCMYEWFYSAIDLPWFARNEFVEYLNHAGLGHVPRLTRVEWGVIRSSLGKPRRLSRRFLQEEREKLEAYRESVRTHYHELRGGLREGLNSDLARPLTVGQRVIAKHRRTKQIHDGSILTVDRSRCRVQFDRPELGVEFVMDIDAMPIYPLENMPEMMKRRRIIMDPPEDLKKSEAKRARVSAVGAARAALNEKLERPGSLPSISPFFLNNLTKRAQDDSVDSVRIAKAATNEAVAATQQAIMTQPCTPGQSQARETDIRTLVELRNALNKKEALVVELRRMNDEAASYKGSDIFQRQYATIILQLKDINDQVYEALKHLRNRNKYEDSAVPPWHRAPPSQPTPVLGRPSFLTGSAEPGPLLVEIASSAKTHAKVLVQTAVETLASCDNEEAGEAILAALAVVERGNASTKLFPAGTSGGVTQGLSASSATSAAVPSASTSDAGDTEKSGSTVSGEGVKSLKVEEVTAPGVQAGGEEYVTDLIVNCVTALMMVQTLTEGQFSPTEVAQALDNALESLRPRHAQNHQLLKEIELQLVHVKTQIVTQIPIQSALTSSADGLTIQPKLISNTS
ncbi:hypothetical protein R1sor_017342 [Riccia sorocarpa]|uniref:Always early n=1 Tax=Riccia sorocarpa TaxID=122646 RepID=A0ABD3IAB5_9MARC